MDRYNLTITGIGILALVVLFLMYKLRNPDRFPAGETDEERRAFVNWCEHRQVGGYQPENEVNTAPPTGGSGVPDKK